MLNEELIKLADNLVGRVDKYCEQILNGEIKACKKLKWACERYKKDKNNSKFYFDKIELLRVYMWAKQFKHRAGVLKGQHIELTDFNLFVVANIFCWRNSNDKKRRIRKVYIQLARKNMKSQLMAIIASYIDFNSKDEQQEIYLAGYDKEQSSIVYREIKYQLDTCDRLKGKYKDSYGKITNIKDGSFIKPLSREARNTGDGTNPSCAIVDEFHAHKTSEIYDVLISGMVAREEPLMVIITTPGFDLSRPCFKEYQYVSKILNPDMPDIINDEYAIIICELEPEDDIKDEENWIKANPIVATYENGMKYLRGELKAALDAPEKMRNFLTKNMGKWVDMKDEGYMDMSKWSKAEVDKELKDFKSMDCIVGVDLSNKLDLTSVAFEFKKDGIYYVFQHSWMPQETYEKRMKEGKYRFDLWVEEGNLTIIPGSTVDYNYILNYLKDNEKQFNLNILEIVYDPWNATMFIQSLEFEGYLCVEARQGPQTLNEPTKDFREQVYNGTMKHGKDGLYTWAMSNAIATQHRQEYIMLDKQKSSEKIDPCAASMNAHFRATKVLENTFDFFYSPG